MKMQYLSFLYVVLILLYKSQLSYSTTYYISPNGNDSNNGTSISTPWKTLKKVSYYGYNTGFNPGTIIKFEAGKVFESDTSFFGSELLIVNSGTVNSYIQITSYDTSNSGLRAIIKAESDKAALMCAGSEYVKISNIDFTSSFNPFNQNNAVLNNNIGIWILTSYGSTNFYLRKKNIIIDSCRISRFLNTGVSIQYSDSDRTRFGGYDGVNITHCNIDSIGKVGIFINWYRNTLYPFSEFGHRNFLIKDCEISRVTGLSTGTTNNGSGILIMDIDTVKIEHNIVYNCGNFGTESTGPSAIESAQCRNLLYQYNEAYGQKSVSGHDGHGLHFGDGVQNSVMQYNYSHNNDGPGLSCFTYNSGYPLRDSNNVIRYNLSSENLLNSDFQTGNINIGAGNGKTIYNINIFNNTIYSKKSSESSGDNSGILIARHAENIFFRNNIIINADTNVYLWYHFPLENSINIVLQGNSYWSTLNKFKFQEGTIIYNSYQSWQNATGKEKIDNENVGFTSDPLLKNPESAGSVNNTYKLDTLSAFQTKVNSVIRENGLNLDSLFGINPGSMDFYGNTIPKGIKFDIGAYEDPTNYVLIDLKMFIEGFYNQSLEKQIGDTVTLNLVSSISPYTVIVSNKSYADTNGKAAFFFNFDEIENSGCYDLYMVINHRNSIQTWSSNYRTYSNWERLNYDFTLDSVKAYGDNMVRKGNVFCIYGGDVNQDGAIDGSDISIIDNDILNAASGYIPSDLNGDQITDGSDYLIAENNASNSVSIISP